MKRRAVGRVALFLTAMILSSRLAHAWDVDRITDTPAQREETFASSSTDLVFEKVVNEIWLEPLKYFQGEGFDSVIDEESGVYFISLDATAELLCVSYEGIPMLMHLNPSLFVLNGEATLVWEILLGVTTEDLPYKGVLANDALAQNAMIQYFSNRTQNLYKLNFEVVDASSSNEGEQATLWVYLNKYSFDEIFANAISGEAAELDIRIGTRTTRFKITERQNEALYVLMYPYGKISGRDQHRPSQIWADADQKALGNIGE